MANDIYTPDERRLLETWGFNRWVMVYSADSPDAMGYCDFAFGTIAPDEDWRAGLVTTDEAMAWRRADAAECCGISG